MLEGGQQTGSLHLFLCLGHPLLDQALLVCGGEGVLGVHEEGGAFPHGCYILWNSAEEN